ncbi:hypothetical protein ACFL5V_05810 [Fibrobacterota bacterium]
MSYYVSNEEAVRLLSGTWLLLPVVPYKISGLEGYDYGDFASKLKSARPGQKVIVFGKNPNALSGLQRDTYKEYIKFVRENRRTIDSLIHILLEGFDARVTVAPFVFSHQVTGSEDEYYQRRLCIRVEGWDNLKKEKILEGEAAVLHRSSKKEDLVSGENLFFIGLEALAEKLLYDPLAGLSPASSPDF